MKPSSRFRRQRQTRMTTARRMATQVDKSGPATDGEAIGATRVGLRLPGRPCEMGTASHTVGGSGGRETSGAGTAQRVVGLGRSPSRATREGGGDVVGIDGSGPEAVRRFERVIGGRTFPPLARRSGVARNALACATERAAHAFRRSLRKRAEAGQSSMSRSGVSIFRIAAEHARLSNGGRLRSSRRPGGTSSQGGGVQGS